MESHQKKRGSMEEEEVVDRLSSLPDDILHSILRGLRLKHAARTSALSRQWAHHWLRTLAASCVVDFTDRDFARGQSPEHAAATVSRCLRLQAEHGPPLEAFRVALDGTLGAGAGAFARDVVGWVVAAVARGAREVAVDLTPSTQGSRAQLDADEEVSATAFMELPRDLFLTETSLARLSLDQFSLRAVPAGAAGLAGLRSLSLSRADVTDETIEAVLSTCRLLEFLSLSSCHLLTSVRIAGDNLRVLELVGCPAMRELRVNAPALESLAFHGNILCLDDSEDDDYAAAVDLGATPALRDAYLSHLGFATEDDVHDKEFAYADFLTCVARARTLTLCSIGLQHMWAHVGYDPTVNIDMTNVQELQLLMASLGDDDIEAVSSFFQLFEFPLLDRLFIRLPRELDRAEMETGVAAALTGEVDDAGILIHGDDFVLGQLKLLKVVNFRGTRLKLVLLSFFMKRAPALEQLVLVLTTVDEDEIPGDEQLKIIQERVSAMRKALPLPEAQVTVCRPSEDRNNNPAHTRFYHEEA